MQTIRGGKIGMIFQDPISSLNPVMRIEQQLIEPLELHLGLKGEPARTRARELLEAVGIPDAARRLRGYPHEFSGGMRQRVIIAIAISTNPKLLIADEPTTALDVAIQAQILELVGLSLYWIVAGLSLTSEETASCCHRLSEATGREI